ncbi:MAG: hypothetical protein NTU98_12900 [Bacteroidetes bacterium]|nr:hypothetical protein [Bacteroidota bacterium]
MTKLGTSLFLLLILSFISCSHETKIMVETYPDGSPKRECVYKGKDETREMIKETTWYPGRKLQMVGEYKANKRDGHWIYYYQNGNIWSEGYFREGKSDGKRITHYENGNVFYEGTYDKDRRVGVWKFYDESGKLVKTLDYTKIKEKASGK